MDTIKLLLVEDDPSLRYIVQSGLEDIIEGYEVLAAANGEEGLAMWREHRPDVILSDIEMPIMDGYEMVKDIALIVLFGLAALFGFAGYGNYSDLVIWSGWCLINAVLAVVSIIKNR